MTASGEPAAAGKVAVLGAGTMGRGIAHVTALAGYPTSLYDIDPEVVEQAQAAIEQNLARGVELGKVGAEEREASLARLATTHDFDDAARDAAIVIEAVPESLELKKEILASAAALVKPTALLASNTSSLSITAIGRDVPGPERVVGLHFFNPVHIMALVEIVRGDRTTDEAVDRSLDFARTLGKEPIVVRDSPGFASSRLGVALGLEAIRMLEEGVASAADIDRAMELGYRHPMGPLRLTDLVGLDVRLGVARYLHRELGGDRFRPPDLLERKVADGKLGKKSGEGFYEW